MKLLHHFLIWLCHHGSRARAQVRARLATLTGVVVGPGVRIGPGCEVALGAAPARRGRVTIGGRTLLERGVLLHAYGGAIFIGVDSYIGPYCSIYGHGGVTIGKDALISVGCRIFSSNHTVPPDPTIIRSQPDLPMPVWIGNDVWLGAGSTVLGGVTIGNGCVIGAGAVVTNDIPPYSVAVGSPARVLRNRLQPPRSP